MDKNNPIEDLQEIRKMMESSSKFLSLSGLSGVFAGLIALFGTWLVWAEVVHFEQMALSNYIAGTMRLAEQELMFSLALIATGILVGAFGSGVLFTWLKARRQGVRLMTPLSLRLLRSLLVPLFFGGCFVIITVWKGGYLMVVPLTLIFYGMSLLNASKYVHDDIKYLALAEMTLGLVAFALIDFTQPWIVNAGRLFVIWAAGFGLLHILYGTILYFRYDYKRN